MRESNRYVLGGVALGAILGGLVGWVYGKRASPGRPSTSALAATPMDSTGVMRLAWSVIGVVRQILELG